MKRFRWTDKLALEFARVTTKGAYGVYLKSKNIKDKLRVFKVLNTFDYNKKLIKGDE